MKILILGSGLMGPAAAFNAMADRAVTQVILADLSQPQLEAGVKQLAGKPGSQKLGVVRLDLSNQETATQLMANFDAIIAALPREASVLAVQAALEAGKPLVDLTIPAEASLPELRRLAETSAALVILGCGLEPGLTELLARHLAEKLDRVDELHIKCGGIPVEPAPPLGYKIVFGGTQLPLREADAWVVENGMLTKTARYSGVETVTFPGVGACEAFTESFMPWLLDLPVLHHLRAGTQKTVRWPGYAAKATLLKELGLLSDTPIAVDGVQVRPKRLVDTLLYPHVKMNEGDQDLTVFRVEAIGELGRPTRQSPRPGKPSDPDPPRSFLREGKAA
ncbi:MAG TPA: saccharopine dehydrogenase C-terminal domain-containing protein, partial [Anaerolineae bacterium]|nr:saccharopine dehydrogenase C-terminal domain-containing protein [Anaerolineae bacterium]